MFVPSRPGARRTSEPEPGPVIGVRPLPPPPPPRGAPSACGSPADGAPPSVAATAAAAAAAAALRATAWPSAPSGSEIERRAGPRSGASARLLLLPPPRAQQGHAAATGWERRHAGAMPTPAPAARAVATPGTPTAEPERRASACPAFLGSPPDHQESDRRAKTTVSRTPGAPRGAWARRGSTTGRQLARCKARPPDWADTMMPPTGSATTSAALALYARPHGLRTAMHRAGQAFAKERRLSSGSSASTTSTTHGPGRRTGCPAWPSGCRNTRARTAAGARPPACSAR